jgi:hypothetical protein
MIQTYRSFPRYNYLAIEFILCSFELYLLGHNLRPPLVSLPANPMGILALDGGDERVRMQMGILTMVVWSFGVLGFRCAEVFKF